MLYLEHVVLVADDNQRHRAGSDSAQVRVISTELGVGLLFEVVRKGRVSFGQVTDAHLDARLRQAISHTYQVNILNDKSIGERI